MNKKRKTFWDSLEAKVAAAILGIALGFSPFILVEYEIKSELAECSWPIKKMYDKAKQKSQLYEKYFGENGIMDLNHDSKVSDLERLEFYKSIGKSDEIYVYGALNNLYYQFPILSFQDFLLADLIYEKKINININRK